MNSSNLGQEEHGFSYPPQKSFWNMSDRFSRFLCSNKKMLICKWPWTLFIMQPLSLLENLFCQYSENRFVIVKYCTRFILTAFSISFAKWSPLFSSYFTTYFVIIKWAQSKRIEISIFLFSPNLSSASVFAHYRRRSCQLGLHSTCWYANCEWTGGVSLNPNLRQMAPLTT